MIFCAYIQCQIHDNGPIGGDWVKVTNGKFNEFRITGYDAFRRLIVDGIVNPRPTLTTFPNNPYYQVDNINIYTKHYPTLFPTFKYQELRDNYNHDTIATAWNQDVDDIFHKSYVTTTPDDMTLIKEKQKYM